MNTFPDTRNDWFTVHGGGTCYILNPEDSMVQIHDIATALSKQCRFAGHCNGFYSVAQHSVLVSRNAPKEYKLYALMHDAAEAYLQDIIKPLKNVIGPDYRTISLRWEIYLALRFDYHREYVKYPGEVHTLDLRALATEHRDLVQDHKYWPSCDDERPFDEQIGEWGWQDARDEFLYQFSQLTLDGSLDEHSR